MSLFSIVADHRYICSSERGDLIVQLTPTSMTRHGRSTYLDKLAQQCATKGLSTFVLLSRKHLKTIPFIHDFVL